MEGVTDSANFNLLDELARLVAAKLSQGDPGPLPSKQWVARSSRARDASFKKAETLPPLHNIIHLGRFLALV